MNKKLKQEMAEIPIILALIFVILLPFFMGAHLLSHNIKLTPSYGQHK